jgi:Mrp family chromosome partitioning ATPase
MTRIFDALRKTQSAREPVALPPTPPVLHPVRPGGAPGRPAPERLDVIPLHSQVTLDDETLRELAALRVSLEGALAARVPRAVIFVCAQPGDGTSTVAFQFAQALAREPDLRVLLVDANLRRGSELIEGARLSVAEARTRGALDLLPLGERLRGAAPISAASFRERLEVAAGGYDWLVVDGSSLLEAPESAPLAAQVDGVVMVVRSGRSKRPVLHRALDLLRRSGAHVLGTVLNRRRLEIPDFIYRRI